MKPAAQMAWSSTIAARMIEALAHGSAAGGDADGDRLAKTVAAYAGLGPSDVAEIRGSVARGRESRQNLVAAAADWATPIDEALTAGRDLPPALAALVDGVTPATLDPLAGEVYTRVSAARAADARDEARYRRLHARSERVEAGERAANAARQADLGAVQWRYRPFVGPFVLIGILLTSQAAILGLVLSWYFGLGAVPIAAAAAWTVVWIRRHSMLLLHDGGLVVTGVTGRLRMVATWHQIAGIDGWSAATWVYTWVNYTVTLRSGQRIRFIAAAKSDDPDLVYTVNRALHG
ncbi:hypothetical protein ACN27J_05990 [Solwaraspora sp. WMMB762]|uniref:hypothetical protein n=1 Tax=Solwaraspora sp. WMMB762 TaxID=3404120 RepID=UPI003B932C87